MNWDGSPDNDDDLAGFESLDHLSIATPSNLVWSDSDEKFQGRGLTSAEKKFQRSESCQAQSAISKKISVLPTTMAVVPMTSSELYEVHASSEKRRTPHVLGEFEVADEDVGFRTPTSAEHRIPLPTTCRPPPKRTRAKATLAGSTTQIRCRRVLKFDDLESVFPKHREPDLQRKTKRARREDESDSRNN